MSQVGISSSQLRRAWIFGQHVIEQTALKNFIFMSGGPRKHYGIANTSCQIRYIYFQITSTPGAVHSRQCYHLLISMIRT